jgi:Ca2+-binding EF-hand superfamily protein
MCRVIVAVALFRHIDKDGSGKLNKAELKQLVKEAEADVPDSKIDELIATTGTGEINFRDFVTALVHYVRSQS